MSDTIPPLYSSSPPPLTKSNFTDDADSEEDEDDDDDDGYGKFEEYSAVYDHTVEEILNNSPRKPLKTESIKNLNSSDLILGKNIPDLPNNLHSTTDSNETSEPLSSDILHSKSPGESIDRKILENNSINVEKTFSDSAINLTDMNNIFSVNKDNLVSNFSTSKTLSEPLNLFAGEVPVLLKNCMNRTEEIEGQVTGGNSCSLTTENNLDTGTRLEVNENFKENKNLCPNIVDGNVVPSSNCSNFTSAVDGTFGDDDFEFDDFQSFSEPIPCHQNLDFHTYGIGVSDLNDKIDVFSLTETLSCESSLTVKAVPPQFEPNYSYDNNLSPVPDDVSGTDKSVSEETSLADIVSSSHPSSDVTKTAVQINSNDLYNGISALENVTENNGNVTTAHSDIEPSVAIDTLVAPESDPSANEITSVKKDGAECIESNSECTSGNKSTETCVGKIIESEVDDGFGDFECANATQDTRTESPSCEPNASPSSDDDFCDFESAETPESLQSEKIKGPAFSEPEQDGKKSLEFEGGFEAFDDESADNFSDFQSTNVGQKILTDDLNLKASESYKQSDDTFGNFEANFSEGPPNIMAAASSKFDDGSEGSFDDFSDFSTYDKSSDVTASATESAAQGNKFWIDLFPPCEEADREIDVVSISDLVVASRIWTKLRDLDSSQALTFEWSKSTTYNKYLSSLNIDVRNVFGVQWRSNVPRFAANLGCTPLEPSKAAKDSYTSKPVSDQSKELSQLNNPAIVPAAHFDWISSGLVNPLDGSYATLLDINLLDAFVNTESTKKKPNSAMQVPKQKAKDEAIDAEVQEFLQNLPDLSFMLVSHIQFPMNPTITDKSS